MLTVDTVQVWLVDPDPPAAVLAELAELLDEDERRRADAIRPDLRRRFVAAHGAARVIVAGSLAAPPGALRWRRGRHGKPELAGAWTGRQVNLSHSGDLVLVALTDRRPVGVDVQRLSTQVDAAGLAARYFPAAEARFVAAAEGAERVDRFIRLWVRKEACVKAAGGRLAEGLALPVRPGSGADHPGSGAVDPGSGAVDPGSGAVDPEGGPDPARPAGAGDPSGGDPSGRRAGAVADAVLVRAPAGPLPGPYLVRDLPVPPGYRAAVALAGDHPYRVTHHRWPPPPVEESFRPEPGGPG